MMFICASTVGILTALVIILIVCVTMLSIIFVLLIGKLNDEGVARVKEEKNDTKTTISDTRTYTSNYSEFKKSYGSSTSTSEYDFSDNNQSGYGYGLKDNSADNNYFTDSNREETIITEEAPKKTAKLANVNIELPKSDWGTKSLQERIASLSNAQRVLYDRVKNLLKNRLNNYTTDICEVYFNRESPAGRLIIYKNQILLFLALEPDTINKEVFYVKDVSSNEAYKAHPTLLLIKTLDQANGIERLVDKILIK